MTRWALATAVLVVALAVWVVAGPPAFDAVVAGDAHDWTARHDAVATVLRVVTWFGHPLVVESAGVLAAVLLWRRRRPAALALLITGIGSVLLRSALKAAIDRPRPVWPDPLSTATGGSFPSGHVAGAAFLGTAAWVLLRRAWVAAAAAVYVVVVAATRVLLGVHWLTDVVGGALLGATFALLLPATIMRFRPRQPQPA